MYARAPARVCGGGRRSAHHLPDIQNHLRRDFRPEVHFLCWKKPRTLNRLEAITMVTAAMAVTENVGAQRGWGLRLDDGSRSYLKGVAVTKPQLMWSLCDSSSNFVLRDTKHFL